MSFIKKLKLKNLYHNEKLKNNPDSLSAQDLEQVKTIRQTADIFRKLISDIKASKRKK